MAARTTSKTPKNILALPLLDDGRRQSLNKAGRPKGALNMLTREVKAAVLEAAAREGEDGKGKGQLIGYLRRLARHEPRSFAVLLGRIIPIQVVGNPDLPFRVVISAEDAKVG